jgi:6-phosphogluconate dehydrogenase
VILDEAKQKGMGKAQRDYFGAHTTYERIDTKGTFHTQWEKE